MSFPLRFLHCKSLFPLSPSSACMRRGCIAPCWLHPPWHTCSGRRRRRGKRMRTDHHVVKVFREKDEHFAKKSTWKATRLFFYSLSVMVDKPLWSCCPLQNQSYGCSFLVLGKAPESGSARFQIGGGSSTTKLLFLSCNLFWFAMLTKLMALCGGV